MKYAVILTPDPEDGGVVAECPAIPGCVSEGETPEQALSKIQQAIEGCLESMAARNEPLPEPAQGEGPGGKVKLAILAIAKALPENCTYEDVHYHLYVREKIERGLKAIEEGDYVTHEEAVRRMREWRKSIGQAQP